MKRCAVCGKIIWFWQKRLQIKWVKDYFKDPKGVTRLYHNPKCMSEEDMKTVTVIE